MFFILWNYGLPSVSPYYFFCPNHIVTFRKGTNDTLRALSRMQQITSFTKTFIAIVYHLRLPYTIYLLNKTSILPHQKEVICVENTDPINPLKPELNSICYLLALLGAHHFLHVSRIRVKLLTFRLLMLYIYIYIYIYIWSTHSWCF